MNARPVQLATLTILTGAFGAGCGSIDNARIDVGGDIPLALEATADRRDETLSEATSRSLTGVSRDHWAPTTIVLAPDGTEHWPRLTKDGPRYMDHNARLTGVSPTPTSALEINTDLSQAVPEFFAGPLIPAWEVVLAIPRIIEAGIHGEPVASPAIPYQRADPFGDAPPATLEPEVAPIDPPAGRDEETG